MEAETEANFPEVEAGIAWLDEKHPGWATRINLDELSLASSQTCVLCQVAEIRSYNYSLDHFDLLSHEAADLGFSLPQSWDGLVSDWFRIAEAQWRRAIAARTASSQ